MDDSFEQLIWIRRKNDADNMHIRITKPPQVSSEHTDGYDLLVLEFTNTVHMPYYLSWGLGDIDRTPEKVDIFINLTLENAKDLANSINYAVQYLLDREAQRRKNEK